MNIARSLIEKQQLEHEQKLLAEKFKLQKKQKKEKDYGQFSQYYKNQNNIDDEIDSTSCSYDFSEDEERYVCLKISSSFFLFSQFCKAMLP